MIRFEEYTGDLLGLPTSANHLNFRWREPDCLVLFSVCQQGKAASCHFFSDKKGLRRLREAIEQWVSFVFWLFDWCDMVIAKVLKKNIGKLLVNCGFCCVAEMGNFSLYVRAR